MQHINSFMGGMKGGVDYTIIPQDSYLYLLNGCIISRDDHGFVITSVKGTEQIASFDANEVPIGSTSFNGILYIITHKITSTERLIQFYSYKGSNGRGWVEGEMLILPNGYDDTLSIKEEFLGYTRMKLLQVFAKESFDGSVDLYICDGLSPNTVVNTGVNRDGILTERVYMKNNTQEFALQRSVTKVPTIESSIGSTGNIRPGTYYVYLRYEDESMNTTPFIKEHGPIFIHSGSSDKSNVTGVHNEGDVRISKSIILKISDLDSIYKKVSIAVVHYFGNDLVLSRDNYLIDNSYLLSGENITVVIDGDNPIRSITVEEILSDNLPYDTSETHLQLDNRYYGANWSGSSIDYANLKQLAMRIMPHAIVHEEDNFENVIDENTDEFEYMEEEIYPFGVSFLIDGRYKTPVFPICGWSEGDYHKQDYLQVPDDPQPMAYDSIYVTATTATITGDVTNEDSVPILERGFIIKKEYIPTFNSYDKKYISPATPFTMSLFLTDLEPMMDYYYCAYATIAGLKTIVSGYKGFITRKALELYEPFDINTDNVHMMGKILDSFTMIASEMGFCWSSSKVPDINDNKITVPVRVGHFSEIISDLEINTEYRAHAFITASSKTYYGNMIVFKTQDGVAILTTSHVYGEFTTINTAIVGGAITSDGGTPVLQRGVEWKEKYNDEIPWERSYMNLIGNTFSDTITGLKKNTLYEVRAFAINKYDTYFGSTKEFLTHSGEIYVETTSVTDITKNTAKAGGIITNTGDVTIRVYGLCYGTRPNPDIFYNNIHTTEEALDGDIFMSTMSYGLSPSTQYYVRAYVVSDIYDSVTKEGLYYGLDKAFITKSDTENVAVYIKAEGKGTKNICVRLVDINNISIGANTVVRVLVDYTIYPGQFPPWSLVFDIPKNSTSKCIEIPEFASEIQIVGIEPNIWDSYSYQKKYNT